MGASVSALCPCGYGTGLLIGCGFCPDRFFWPAACDRCRAVVQVDLQSSPVVCPDCGSPDVRVYGEPGTVGEDGDSTVVEWRMPGTDAGTLSLRDGTYLCPSCGEYALRFRDAGLCWD